MIQPELSFPYDPNRLLDTLSIWLGMRSDTGLAGALRLSPEVIHGIRAGRVLLRPSLLIQMAERAGRSLAEVRLVLGERRKTARMPRGIQAA